MSDTPGQVRTPEPCGAAGAIRPLSSELVESHAPATRFGGFRAEQNGLCCVARVSSGRLTHWYYRSYRHGSLLDWASAPRAELPLDGQGSLPPPVEIPYSSLCLHDDSPVARSFTTFPVRFESRNQQSAVIPLFSLHLARLVHDAEHLGFEPPSPALIAAIVRHELGLLGRLDGAERWKVRIILDAEKLEHAAEPFGAPSLPPDHVRAVTVAATRERPGIKSTHTTISRFARRQAEAAGAHEALLVGADGCIAEGAWSNLVWMDRRGGLYAPASPHLPGTVLQSLVRRHGVKYRPCTHETLGDADGAAITQSTSGVCILRTVDGLRLPCTTRFRDFVETAGRTLALDDRHVTLINSSDVDGTTRTAL